MAPSLAIRSMRLGGRDVAIDPTADPIGYGEMLGQHYDERVAKQRADEDAGGYDPGVQFGRMQQDAAMGRGGPNRQWAKFFEPENVQAENNPGTKFRTDLSNFGTRSGGNMASRQSIDALRGGRSDNMQTILDASEDPRLNQPGFQEEWRQARMRNDESQRLANNEDSANAADFDLGSGRAAGRERMAGAIRDESKMGDARLGSDIYFDPKVKKQREDELYQKMQELRTRYADPAIIKGQSQLAEAQTRGMYGVQRENARGDANYATQGLRNEGNVDTADVRARAAVGAAVAGAGGKPADYGAYVPQAGAPAPRGAVQNIPNATGGAAASNPVMTQAELAAFASQNGLAINDALGIAQYYGYTVR